MNRFHELDYYVYHYFSKEIQNNMEKLKVDLMKIFHLEEVEGLDHYSKELILLATKKRMMMTIENNSRQNHESCWNQNGKKMSNDDFIGYIDLFIKEFYTPIQKDSFKEIIEFYNNEMHQASLKMVIKLPNGEKVSSEDIIGAIHQVLTNRTVTSSYQLKKVKYQVKKIAVLSSMISILGMTSINATSVYEEPTEIQNDVLENDSNQSVHAGIYSNNYAKLFDDSYGSLEDYDIPKKQTFIGYDNACPKEYQEFIYEMSKKYDISFNIMMTIAHIESGGNFNNNGLVNDTDDYGYYQINIINHDGLKEQLGYTSDDLLYDPYKNIEAAALIIKSIYNMYENPDIEDILGTYNGWTEWRKKEISIDYVKKGLTLYQEVYNKQEDQLFESIESKRKL